MSQNQFEITTPKTQKIYKVSEITRHIRGLLESEFRSIWVEGEISNFKKHSSGHMYFTLKDESAQIGCVFFARENQQLKFELKDGLQVICIGRISVYEARGQYQIYVSRAEPKGLGALQLAFRQLKERLEKEGLFAQERKRSIPKFPKKIGIITSPTGAAIQDMLKIFHKRPYGLEIMIYPARVQGEGSAGEIAEGIRRLNDFPGLDVLIVGRGGGSLEDLWAFNEETVARAVAGSRIPVISAVGHEVDWTISDFAADFRAHTPTAAAEKMVMFWDEVDEKLRQTGQRMRNAIQVVFENNRQRILRIRDSYGFKNPLHYLDEFRQRVDEFARQIQNYARGYLERQHHRLRNLAGKLETLSPLAILNRGYSLTFDHSGHVLKDSKRAAQGMTIRTRLHRGVIESKVTKSEG